MIRTLLILILLVLSSVCAIEVMAQDGDKAGERLSRQDLIRAGAGLKIENRDTRRVKLIPFGTQVIVETKDQEIRGVLQAVDGERIILDVGVFDFNDIYSIGKKDNWTKLSGVGVALIGLAMVAGGVAYVALASGLAVGMAGVATGVGVLSMCPSIFKYGRRFHLDGEWRLVSQL